MRKVRSEHGCSGRLLSQILAYQIGRLATQQPTQPFYRLQTLPREHVERGDVIAYVGTSANAPPGTPHPHFALFELGPERHWWQSVPIDPYLVFKR
jgi:hypothetical protein